MVAPGWGESTFACRRPKKPRYRGRFAAKNGLLCEGAGNAPPPAFRIMVPGAGSRVYLTPRALRTKRLRWPFGAGACWRPRGKR